MKTHLRCVCLVLLLFALQSWSWADFCDPCEPIDCTTRLSAWNFGGWLEAGVMLNQHSQKDAYS